MEGLPNLDLEGCNSGLEIDERNRTFKIYFDGDMKKKPMDSYNTF